MSFIKEKWFLILNILIFAGSVALYFTGVSGQSAKIEGETKNIERATKSLRGLANKKPTAQWDSVLEGTQVEIAKNKSYIYDKIGAADNLIHRYYDVSNPDMVTKNAPDLGNYLVYKSNLVKKWDALKEKYTQELIAKSSPSRSSATMPRGRRGTVPPPEFFGEFEDPSMFGFPGSVGGSAVRSHTDDEEEEQIEIKHFRCDPATLARLEPFWLRNDAVPETPLDLLNAMKQYWITVELLRVLEVIDIDALLAIQISEPMRTDSYKLGENDFWGFREISLNVELKVGKTSQLLKEIHASPYLFRSVGFNQENILDLPEGVSSDAPHVTFDDLKERHLLTLNLWHFDYLQEGEVLAAEVVDPNSGRSSRTRSTSRGRSRR